MKSLKKYIAESTQVHVYHIKLAINPTAEQVNTVESLLHAYKLVDFSKPTKIDDDRFDFFDIHPKEVHDIRFTTEMPLSSYVVMQQIRDALGIPEKHIVLRAVTEPVELEAEEQRFKQKAEADAKAKGFTFASRLDTDRLHDPAEEPVDTDVFGDEYNKNLLAHLANIKADRKSSEVEPHSGLFSWLEMKKVKLAEPLQDESDFNAHIDTPKPVTKKTNKPAPVRAEALGPEGNFDDGARNNYVMFADKQNKRKTTQAPRADKKLKR